MVLLSLPVFLLYNSNLLSEPAKATLQLNCSTTSILLPLLPLTAVAIAAVVANAAVVAVVAAESSISSTSALPARVVPSRHLKPLLVNQPPASSSSCTVSTLQQLQASCSADSFAALRAATSTPAASSSGTHSVFYF
jgi:hypothetical protein